MTGMMIFNLIAAIAVVAGLVTIFRTAYVWPVGAPKRRSLWKPRISEMARAASLARVVSKRAREGLAVAARLLQREAAWASMESLLSSETGG